MLPLFIIARVSFIVVGEAAGRTREQTRAAMASRRRCLCIEPTPGHFAQLNYPAQLK
jgi:hypothetical protein